MILVRGSRRVFIPRVADLSENANVMGKEYGSICSCLGFEKRLEVEQLYPPCSPEWPTVLWLTRESSMCIPGQVQDTENQGGSAFSTVVAMGEVFQKMEWEHPSEEHKKGTSLA